LYYVGVAALALRSKLQRLDNVISDRAALMNFVTTYRSDKWVVIAIVTVTSMTLGCGRLWFDPLGEQGDGGPGRQDSRMADGDPGSVSYVGHGNSVIVGNGIGFDVPVPAMIQAGDLMLAIFHTSSTGTSSVGLDVGWDLVVGPLQSSAGARFEVSVARKTANNAEPSSYLFRNVAVGNRKSSSGVIVAYRGATIITEQHTVVDDFSTQLRSPAVPLASGCMMVRVAGQLPAVSNRELQVQGNVTRRLEQPGTSGLFALTVVDQNQLQPDAATSLPVLISDLGGQSFNEPGVAVSLALCP
jgi:hypothetical protein